MAQLIARIELDSNFPAQFYKDILNEIHKKFMKTLPIVVSGIKSRLVDLVRNSIMASPEYGAIVGGELRGELGLPDGAQRIDAIISRWAEGISVKYVKGRGTALGMIDIGVLQSDWEDVLSMQEAELSYASRKGVKTLEWLRWLLKEGGAVIVSQYDFIPEKRGSRTGLGIMVRRRGGWKVPAQFAGTEEDNFATRALEDIEESIDVIVRRELTKVM